MSFEPAEIQKLEKYLKSKVNSQITLKYRPKADDSAEFLISGEYMGTVYKDEEDGDISYIVNLSILSIDLDGE
jgi:hypothetical protein